jgi:ketosteroid isomerase-like protein
MISGRSQAVICAQAPGRYPGSSRHKPKEITKMFGRMLVRTALALSLAGLASTQIQAQTNEPAENEIRAALTQWTADFNARNSRVICDLFALDLRYDYQGFPERGYQDVCALLQRSLGDSNKRYSYSPAIKEIIVAGDIAVVRLAWTLTVRTEGDAGEVTITEPGMDVFRKQPGGSWKIIRYVAYGTPK